jgi:DNA-binding winged helix-turn-helix (wHTH) protein/Flp pilus assembly protein TadD
MLSLGPWIFDRDTRRLIRHTGEGGRLSPKAAAVLEALAETPGRVWSRDALLERVWPTVTVGEEILTHAVAELRRTAADDARAPALVETIHKSGYRLLVQPESWTVAAARERSAADARRDRIDLGLYVDYLEACTRFERGGAENYRAALDLFRRILAEAPDHVGAHVGAAKALLFLLHHDVRCGESPKAVQDDCAAARRLDPFHGEAVAIEGLLQAAYGRPVQARRRFEEALALAPASGEVHHLVGRACFAHLEPRLAAVLLERAAALQPDDYNSQVLAGTAWEMTGDTDRARRNYRLGLARVEARLQADPDGYKPLSNRAHSLLGLHRHEEAASALEAVCAHPSPVRHSPACLLARAGDSEGALDVLELSLESGWGYAAWLERDPCLAPLRDLPRFKRLAGALRAPG